jgi:hypothetical protein
MVTLVQVHRIMHNRPSASIVTLIQFHMKCSSNVPFTILSTDYCPVSLKCAEGRETEEHLFLCCAFFVVLITVAAVSQEC